ncbi:MAG: EamA family transporter, partial [Proteobacteria bacterium]|nr:EamA family transporter [Pseudomonadota bacterium]
FKEKFTKTKIFAIILGFIGAAVVVNPAILIGDLGKSLQDNTINYHMLYIFLAIIFWTGNTMVVKMLGNTEKTETQMFYLLFFASIITLPVALTRFASVTFVDNSASVDIYWDGLHAAKNMIFSSSTVYLVAVMAGCYFTHGISYFNALKSELSIVVPFRYTKLIFSTILGYVFFNEVESLTSYIGYVFIVLAGLMLLRREIGNRRRALVSASKHTATT